MSGEEREIDLDANATHSVEVDEASATLIWMAVSEPNMPVEIEGWGPWLDDEAPATSVAAAARVASAAH